MKQFSKIAGLVPGRSVFDLSHEVKLTCDMGQLIPIMCDEVVPGDKWQIGNEIVVRFQPLVAPVLHEINAFVHYFFVPYRLLWTDWEDFITGGPAGTLAPTLPTWDVGAGKNVVGSLWDYLGFPVGIDAAGARPISFPRDAYNLIYNEYYRDETQISEIALTSEDIRIRAWEKDYFTSALPWQQRGTAPALPISGTTSAVWAAGSFVQEAVDVALGVPGVAARPWLEANNATARTNLSNMFNANTVNLATATTFNVADLRLAFQIQKWMERNARAGARYTEFLKAHFGVAPRDERLQRPEYIGGSRSPVIVSEVLQTSTTAGTPQGNMAGHGLVADESQCASYFATEFGLIMGILSVMPRPTYQQGIDRQWLRETRFDFYSPEFAHLSEQAILRREIFCSAVEAENRSIWGYQGRYDEMRVKRSRVAGLMGTTFDYWHLSRQFAAAPVLNQTFLECVPRKDIFAVPGDPGLIVNVRNVIRAVRPLPIEAAPGLIDHA